MKTYTMSWKMYGKFGCKGYSLCREKIWPLLKLHQSFKSSIDFFLWLIDERNHNFGSAHSGFRLSSCGRLVARSATYQGV